MGTIVDRAMGLLDRQMPGVLKAAGEGSVQGIRQDISTAYPPASKPGQPPHYREGKLFQGIECAVFQGDDEVTISAYREGTPMVAFWLEVGTKKMAARPFMSTNMLDESNLAAALEKF